MAGEMLQCKAKEKLSCKPDNCLKLFGTFSFHVNRMSLVNEENAFKNKA